MFLLRLWNYFRGYVIINVSGYFIEKFINLCANKGMYLWGIKRKGTHNMILRISTKGFKSLRGVAKKTKCKVKIVKKIGIPFIKFRYRKRKSFIAGFLLFFILIYTLSSFIWVIEINPLQNVSAQTILDFLQQNGLQPGVIKRDIDKFKITNEMIMKIDGISWCDVKLVGTKVVVDVVEKIPKPIILDRTTPCNIYSNINGVIKNITTKGGIALVKEGSVVKKGQMLVTGIIENRWNPQEVRYVHSDAIINGSTWYFMSYDVDLIEVKKERTNEYKVGYAFKGFSNYYNIFRANSPYEIFDQEEKSYRLSIWKDFVLPAEMIIKKYYKANYNTYNLTQEQAQELAKKQAIDKINSIIPKEAEQVNQNVEYELINEGKTVRAKLNIECLEEIGYKEKIEIQ